MIFTLLYLVSVKDTIFYLCSVVYPSYPERLKVISKFYNSLGTTNFRTFKSSDSDIIQKITVNYTNN